MFYMRRPTDEHIRHLLSEAASMGPTYPEVGATRTDDMPRPYAHNRWQEIVGSGRGDYEAAKRALMTWAHARLHWVDLTPPDAVAHTGAVVSLNARAMGIYAVNPVQIVYEEENAFPDRTEFAIAAGTLAFHAATGEERFSVVYSTADETVTYVLRSFSRPRHIFAWLGFFYVRRKQRRFAKETAKALAAAIRSCPLRHEQP